MSKRPKPDVLNLPAGVPFLPAFCHAFLNAEVIDHYPDRADPLALARAKIFVPTRRAARALTIELQKQIKADAVILPAIVTLGHFEQIENDLMFTGQDMLAPDLPPQISPMRRHVELMRLIYAWAQAARNARLSTPAAALDFPTFLAIDPPHAWYLARDLAALMDEMIIEDIDWAALEKLVPDQFDDYWGVTLDFLKIATQAWPHFLSTVPALDAALRQKQLVAAEIARLEAAPPTPLIALGSTGTNRSTAHLLRAIAHAPQGAIVLPGLDLDMDERSWNMLGTSDDGMSSGATHPQAALHRLLTFLRVERGEVKNLATPSAAIVPRMRLVQQALRPAETTDEWYQFNRQHEPAQHRRALTDVSLIEARDEREEALCIALKLREVLTRPDHTAALISPDRNIAQRVQAELKRWQIDIDDSGGQPLSLTPMGRLARLTFGLYHSAPLQVLPLLAHEYVSCGYQRAEVDVFAHIYELAIARTLGPDDAPMHERISYVMAQAQERHAHPAKKRITPEQWQDFALFMQNVEAMCAPLRGMQGPASLAQWVKVHSALIEAVRDPARERGEDDALLQLVWEELTIGARPDFTLSAQEYAALLDSILSSEMVRGPMRAHPRLKILGLLEARLLHVDVAILAGLDEMVWPPHVKTDAFLNRPMRAQLGLSPPERRIGQTAHDFSQLMGASEVVLTRAAKRAGAPTVPSRFLQRLAALVGEEVWAECAQRGRTYQQWAQRIDHPSHDELSHARRLSLRPRPAPPLDLRPRQLSVTRIETLRRDPYAIYAEYILRLIPLDPIGAASGAREMGTLIHELMARYARQWRAHAPSQYDVMQALAQEQLRTQLANHAFRLFQWPHYWRALEHFMHWDEQRRGQISDLFIETNGRLDVLLDDGSSFRLTAQADRIEASTESLRIIDFKTGRIPTFKQIKAGFAPQLTLETIMAEKGGFADIAAQNVAEAFYVKFRADEGAQIRHAADKDMSLATLAAQHYAGLLVLLNQFRSPDMVYPARPYPQYVNEFSDYDHLARVKEWSIAGTGEGE